MKVKSANKIIMPWSAITNAGVDWFCNIDGNIEKVLHRDILVDELVLTMDDASWIN